MQAEVCFNIFNQNDFKSLLHFFSFLFRLLMAVGSVYVTMLTVSVLSVERYIAICHPFLASKNQQSSLIRAIKIITGLWLVGFVFALPASLQFTVVHHPEIPSLSMCTVITETGIIVAGLCSFTFYFIPMLVICMMYLQIGLTLRESVKSIRSHNESTHESKQRAPKLISKISSWFSIQSISSLPDRIEIFNFSSSCCSPGFFCLLDTGHHESLVDRFEQIRCTEWKGWKVYLVVSICCKRYFVLFVFVD